MFYKETNFQGTTLGRVPKDWQVDKLENLCEKIKAGGTPLTTNKGFWNGNIPFAKIEDMTISGKYLLKTFNHVSRDGLDNSSSWMVPEKSLLLAMYGSFGEIAINKIPVATNQAIIGVIPRQRDDVEFLYYWYLFFKPEWRRYVKPTTQANLTAEIVRGSFVPMPYQPERKAIVEVLSCVDLAIQKTDEVVAKTERLKKGLMQKLLTEGIGHKEYKDTEIGKTPKTWEKTTIDKECLVGTGGTPSRNTEEYFGGNIPWVKSTEVDYNVITSTEETITKKGLENSNAKVYPADSLVMALYGQGTTRGKCALLGIDAAVNQACAVIQSKGRIHIPYLFYWCQHSYSQIRSLSQGANQSNLNMGIVRSLELPLPPPPEQKKIVEILSTADKKLELEKSERLRLERIKRGLMDLLLTGKIRVKVD